MLAALRGSICIDVDFKLAALLSVDISPILTMQHLPKNMGHVDRRELFTSLPARIAYLHAFLEFGPDDVAALIDGQKYIKMVVPAVVNMVYKKLLRHDITARVFSTRDSRSEVDPEEWVTEEGPQIRNRKMFLRWYLTKLNTDPTSMEYWEYLDKVGYVVLVAYPNRRLRTCSLTRWDV